MTTNTCNRGPETAKHVDWAKAARDMAQAVAVEMCAARGCGGCFCDDALAKLASEMAVTFKSAVALGEANAMRFLDAECAWEAASADPTTPIGIHLIAMVQRLSLEFRRRREELVGEPIADHDSRDRIDALEDALREALDGWEESSSYKGDYLREKHNDLEQISVYRGLLPPEKR